MNFSFDELLELSQKGDNRTIDMLVGDIYGGLDYSKVNFAVDLISIYNKCSSYSERKNANSLRVDKYESFYNILSIDMAEYSLVLNNSRLVYRLPPLLQVLGKLYQKKRSLKTTGLKTYHSLFYG